MNYGRRRFRGYSRASRAYRRTFRNGSSAIRRAAGNYRAALQQRDSTQINLSVPTQITASCHIAPFTVYNYFNGPTEADAAIDLQFSGVYALNIWDLIRRSSFYQSYASMYDQVKIDRIRLKLTPGSFTQTTGINYQSFTVVTAWDRTGLSEEQLALNTNTWDAAANGPGSDSIGTTGVNGYGLYVRMTGDDVATYSSAVTKSVNPNTSTSIIRTLYPRTTAEKGYYCNTADIDKWYTGYANGHWYGIDNDLGIRGKYTNVTNTTGAQFPVPIFGQIAKMNSKAYQGNPCYILESPNIPFKPTLLVGLLNKTSITAPGQDGANQNADPSITFYVEADIGVTFRGLRKAPLVQ